MPRGTEFKRDLRKADALAKGSHKRAVEGLLGPADAHSDREFIYYMSPRSGYSIRFDSADRVEAVRLWVG